MLARLIASGGGAARVRSQIRTSKIQDPEKIQHPSINNQGRARCAVPIRYWILDLLWSLNLGCWMFYRPLDSDAQPKQIHGSNMKAARALPKSGDSSADTLLSSRISIFSRPSLGPLGP